MDQVVRREIGGRFRECREAADLSQEEVAEFVRVTHQTVSKWESGKSMPRSELWPRLAAFIGFSLDYVVLNIRTVPVRSYGLVAPRPSAPVADAPSGTPEHQPAS
jgi:transcriptional regulator with XRE-family HTH domain